MQQLDREPQKVLGRVAQLVEQWIENPCVGGSSPPPTTSFSLLLRPQAPNAVKDLPPVRTKDLVIGSVDF